LLGGAACGGWFFPAGPLDSVPCPRGDVRSFPLFKGTLHPSRSSVRSCPRKPGATEKVPLDCPTTLRTKPRVAFLPVCPLTTEPRGVPYAVSDKPGPPAPKRADQAVPLGAQRRPGLSGKTLPLGIDDGRIRLPASGCGASILNQTLTPRGPLSNGTVSHGPLRDWGFFFTQRKTTASLGGGHIGFAKTSVSSLLACQLGPLVG